MAAVQEYLDAYDRQLRTDAETPSAVTVTPLGPLRLATFAGVVVSSPIGISEVPVARRSPDGWRGLLRTTVRILGSPASSGRRAHTTARRRSTTRVRNGFVPGEPESIMIGEAALLAVDVPSPKGIRLRRVTSEPDVRALSAMHEEIFGGGFAEEMADALLRRLGFGGGMELWVAEADGEIVKRRPPGACARHGVRRDLGRRHTPGMAWSRDLPGAHGGSCTISARAWQEADP